MSLDGILEGLKGRASSGIVHFKESLRRVISASTLLRDTKSDDRFMEDQIVIEAYPLCCVREIFQDVAGQWLQLHC
jgi:hypothetical protein